MSFKETELGKIPSDWKVKSISECLYIKGRIGWKGLKKSEYIEKSDYRIINGSALDGKNIDWNKCGYISEERYEESPEIMLKKNDIVMTKDGTIGKVAIIKELESKTTVASGLFVIRVIREDVSYKYLYYYFVSRYFKELVKSRIEGSVIPHLYQRDLVELKIPMPMIEEQKAIAKILSDLDEKIEVNNKINKNLEEMAQAIFKQWFVDFEFPNEEGKPYKSSGGEMVESELGMIPKGFKVKEFGDIINITSGKRPKNKSKEYNKETNIPLIGASSVMGFTNDFNFDTNILVIGRVGTHGVVQRFNYKVWASDNTLVIKSNCLEFSNQILKSIDYKSLNRGSTQPLITQGDIKQQKIIFPNVDLLKDFEKRCFKLMNLFENNVLENERLEKLRDTLLPKLMSGEIRVPLENSEN